MDLRQIFIIKDKKYTSSDVSYLLYNIQRQLDHNDFWTEIESEQINFNQVVRSSSKGNVNIDAFKVIRQGSIKLGTMDNQQIKVICSINVVYLIVFSISFGFVVGLVGIIFYNAPFLIGVLISLIIGLIGFISIRVRLKDLILSSFEKL